MDLKSCLSMGRKLTLSSQRQVQPQLTAKHSQEAPSNLTVANEDSYTVSFGNHHGPVTPRPGLANFLFECEFGLIDQMPSSSAQGKWTPYPQGKYACTTDSPGTLGMRVVKNDFGWSMAYRDIGFLIKVVYYKQALQSSAQSFDFVVNYTNDRDRHRFRTVAYGEWRNTNGNTAGTSSR